MLTNSCCPVCGAQAVPFLEQEAVPVHQHLVYEERQAAVQIPRGRLTLCVCQSCEFVFNSSFDENKLHYSRQYDNTQLASTFFQSYINDLVHHLVFERHVQNARIVEVGCGKGAFLRALIAAEDAHNTGIGFDPSYVGAEIDLQGRLRFERRLYDESCSDTPADVIICRHVIEHLADPVRLLRTIRAALVNSPQARLFFETPDLEWILRRQVIWDLFYEHCSYFTRESLTTAFERAGFSVETVVPQFGGQYLWLEAVNRPPQHISKYSEGIASRVKEFAQV